MALTKIYNSIINLNSTQIYSIFASLGVFLMNSIVLVNITFNQSYYWSYHFWSSLIALIYAGALLVSSILAFWGAIIVRTENFPDSL